MWRASVLRSSSTFKSFSAFLSRNGVQRRLRHDDNGTTEKDDLLLQRRDADQRIFANVCQTLLLEEEKDAAVHAPHGALSNATAEDKRGNVAQCYSDDDDDVFVSEELDASALAVVASSGRFAATTDIAQLVTDEFVEYRKQQLEQRRQLLYDLCHPNLLDYAYNGALVPPPPLNFGQLTAEALRLGHALMVGPQYSLVKQADPSSDHFFEINDLYQEIVFVGRANAGKSSLINALMQQPELARTSSTPNTTRHVSFYQSVTPDELKRFGKGNPNKLVKLPGGGLQLTFVDVPGFGIEGMSDSWRDKAIQATDAYLGVRRSVNTVFLCIEADRGFTKTDEKYFDWLQNLNGVFWIILTKCDAVPHSRVCRVMRQIYAKITQHRRKYTRAYPFVLPVSAHANTNIDQLRALIVETSGIINGERLRQLLLQESRDRLRALHKSEGERIIHARYESRAAAIEMFAARNATHPAMSQQLRDHCKRTVAHLKSHQHSDNNAGDGRTTGDGKRHLLNSSTTTAPTEGANCPEEIDKAVEAAIEEAYERYAAQESAQHNRMKIVANQTDDTATSSSSSKQTLRLHTGIAPSFRSSIEREDRQQPLQEESTPTPADPSEAVQRQLGEDAVGASSTAAALKDAVARRSPVIVRHKDNSVEYMKDGQLVTAHPDGSNSWQQRRHRIARDFVHAEPEPGMTGKMTPHGAKPKRAKKLERRMGIKHAFQDRSKRKHSSGNAGSLREMTASELASYDKNRGATLAGEDFHGYVKAMRDRGEIKCARSMHKREEMTFSEESGISYGSQPVGLLKKYGGNPKGQTLDGSRSRVLGL